MPAFALALCQCSRIRTGQTLRAQAGPEAHCAVLLPDTVSGKHANSFVQSAKYLQNQWGASVTSSWREVLAYCMLRERCREGRRESEGRLLWRDRDWWLFCPDNGKVRPSADQSFIPSKGPFILSSGHVGKTSLMMIRILSGLKC